MANKRVRKKLKELNVGDKFWFADVPYVVIDMDFKNFSSFTDYSNLVPVMSLATYKIAGMTGDAWVGKELGEMAI